MWLLERSSACGGAFSFRVQGPWAQQPPSCTLDNPLRGKCRGHWLPHRHSLIPYYEPASEMLLGGVYIVLECSWDGVGVLLGFLYEGTLGPSQENIRQELR